MGEVAERALDACQRLGKFFDAVHGDEPSTGLWLLDVLQNQAADDKPPLVDPNGEWEKVRAEFLVVGHPAEPLPPARFFAGETPTPAEMRRKAVPSAIRAALIAPGHLLADLTENCRREPGGATDDSDVASQARSEQFDWAAIRQFLGDRSGHFFYELAEQVRGELARGLAAIEGTHRHAMESSSLDRQSESTRADGPEPGTRNFWFAGQRYEMTKGNMTVVINFLWSARDRRACVDAVINEVWTRRQRDCGPAALSSLRRHCNQFFDQHGIPLAIAIESSGVSQVLIRERPDN